jgi:hypothetical protein
MARTQRKFDPTLIQVTDAGFNFPALTEHKKKLSLGFVQAQVA